MIVIRTETFSNLENEHFRRMKYLYSLLKNKKKFLFLFNKAELAETFRRVPGLQISGYKKVFDHDVSLVIFDINEALPRDAALVKKCNERGIPIIQFCNPKSEILENALLVNSHDIDPGRNNIICSGPQYLILHHNYIHFNKKEKRIRERTRRIFISTGDVLSYRELRNLSETLINHGFLLTIGPLPTLKKFNKKTLKRIYPGIRFTGKRETHARAYYETDISITNPGLKVYESMATGTPAIVIFEDREKAKNLKNPHIEKCAIMRGKKDVLEGHRIVDLIRDKFSFSKRKQMGKEGKELIDGMGIFRIIKKLEEKRLI